MACAYKDCNKETERWAMLGGKKYLAYCATHYERVRNNLMLTQKREASREVISMRLRERHKEKGIKGCATTKPHEI